MTGVHPLDDFSRRFARRLFSALPELEGLGLSEPQEKGALLLELPPPTGEGRSRLSISTERAEVTVGFDRFHEHFGWSDVPDEEAFDEAIISIGDFIEERQLVGVVIEGDRWLGTTLLPPGEWPSYGPGQWAYLRSFRGTFDERRGAVPPEPDTPDRAGSLS